MKVSIDTIDKWEQRFFEYFNGRVGKGAVGPLRGGEVALVRLVFTVLRGEVTRGEYTGSIKCYGTSDI